MMFSDGIKIFCLCPCQLYEAYDTTLDIQPTCHAAVVGSFVVVSLFPLVFSPFLFFFSFSFWFIVHEVVENSKHQTSTREGSFGC